MKIFSKVFRMLSFATEYFQDLVCYMKYNSSSPLIDRQRRLFYKIIIETHTVEKGLSLPNPRTLFGREKLKTILKALKQYSPNEPKLPVKMAANAFADYIKFHRAIGVDDPSLTELEHYLAGLNPSLLEAHAERSLGASAVSAGSDAHSAAAQLILTRASTRALEVEPLSRDLVKEIVRIAQASPSQCNRQSTKVHFYQNREKIDALLKLQKGANGFSQDVGNLFVVTSEITAWGGAKQRNQSYVDGALFAMCLLLSCHAAGVGSCPLNLAISNDFERKIKGVGGIPANERLIVMIAVGYPKTDIAKVARSPRRELSEVLRFADHEQIAP